MSKNLRKIPQQRPENEKSAYIGSDNKLISLGNIYAQVSPASDNYSIAAYGERISKIFTVTADTKEDVRNGDILVIDGEKCKVISVMKYTTHTTINVERMGIYER